jgi:hypothetical protein
MFRNASSIAPILAEHGFYKSYITGYNTDMLPDQPDVFPIVPDGLAVLGVPTGTDNFRHAKAQQILKEMAPPTAVLSLLSPRTALHLLIRCYNQLPAYLLRTTSDLSTISDLAKTFDNSMSEAVAAVLQLDPSDEFTTRLYLPRKFCVLGFSRHDGSTRFCPSWLFWTSLLPTTHPKISSPITYPTGNTGSVAVSGTFPFPACLVRHSQGRHIHHD